MQITGLKLTEVAIQFEIGGVKYEGHASAVGSVTPVRREQAEQACCEGGNGHAVSARAAARGFTRDNPPLSAQNKSIGQLRASGMKASEIGKKFKMDPSQIYSRLGTVKAYVRRRV